MVAIQLALIVYITIFTIKEAFAYFHTALAWMYTVFVVVNFSLAIVALV